MKKLALIGIGLVAVCTLAQTMTSPQRVDWRYHFSWDDPNPAGMVKSWRICASNSPSLVFYYTTPDAITTSMRYDDLLITMPPGLYAMGVAPITDDNVVQECSTNHYIMWLGKIKPGQNLQSGR